MRLDMTQPIEDEKKKEYVIKDYRLRKSVEAYTDHRERSFKSHANRVQRLNRSVQTLRELGHNLQDIKHLKQKHVFALVEHWKENKISTAEIKNRMTDMRWIAGKINKQSMIPRTNRELGIEDRKMPSNDINRAVTRSKEELARISDDCTRMSLRGQELFGLRKKESIMLNVQRDYDEKNGVLRLKDRGSGTKGGRPREIPIRNKEQRQYLIEAKNFQQDHKIENFIGKKYDGSNRILKEQMSVYEKNCERAGLTNNHGLRHHYAQTRYEEITGNKCPRQGGKTFSEMTPDERLKDTEARMIVSAELGHGREYVTRTYLGR